ncbi:MAG: DUF4344 domain-containing metallopeptidase [Prosthecobacter sp.]
MLTALCATCIGADLAPPQKEAEATPQVPPYRSSVVGTDFDFITEADPDTFERLEDKGQGSAEMPDKSDGSAPLRQEAFLFVAHFNDGTRVNLAIDADFKTQDSARQEALRYTPRLGRLPTALRRGVARVVIHMGGENVTAFSDVGLIVLYSDNVTKRIGTHDLEETVFHESVHAAWDKAHAGSAAWQDAQKKDGGHITDYARKNPQGEDLAESALFAYTLLHHPDRIPKDEAEKIVSLIPNRIAFVEKLLPKDEPLHFTVAQEAAPLPPPQTVAGPKPQPPATPQCEVDLRLTGQMKDVLSNVLLRAEHKPSAEVKAFLEDPKRSYATGEDLLKAAAEHFKIDPKKLAALAAHWRHINCKHAAIPGHAVPNAPDTGRDAPTGEGETLSPVPVSAFAADVTLHVVLHELGHAVIREFDLMVLGNEETMADAFATHLLTEHFPEQAARVISARVTSLMIEANEVPRDQWPVRGEHDNDARRAYQIAALATAADKEKYAGVAEIVGMAKRDIDKACDYGADIHRAWRRTLAPLMMPAGKVSDAFGFHAAESMDEFLHTGNPSLASTIQSVLQRIDWHSTVTVEFVRNSGGAAWSRSKRTVTVNSSYVERFIAQGVKAEAR